MKLPLNYERIAEVNKNIKYTDVRGKNYAEVAQRVQAFRNLMPDGYITTDIIRLDPGIVYMKAEVGYYAEDGRRIMLSTGLAFERQDASNINKTSFIENCETSAIGRALGFVGLGSEKSIASAEEVANAIDTQEAIENGKIPAGLPAQHEFVPAGRTEAAKFPPATVERTDVIPDTAPVQNPPQIPANNVLEYFAKEREDLRAARGITKAENNSLWTKQIEVLTANNLIPNKKLSEFTMQEAQTMVNYMYSLFTQTGTELISNDGQTA